MKVGTARAAQHAERAHMRPERTERQRNGLADGRTDFTDGRTDGRADGWIDGFIDVMKFYSMSDRDKGRSQYIFRCHEMFFKCHLLIIEYLSVHLLIIE